MSLKVQIQRQGDNVHLRLAGSLDESAQLPAYPDGILGRLIVDLEQLNMINSMGIRKWVDWTKTIRCKGGMTLIKCSTAVVTQLNVLYGFLPPDAKVESFFVPYHCDHCGHEEAFLWVVSGQQPENTRVCPKCADMMEIEVIRERYFSFLKKKAA
jgi:anti-anti-sigma regulatory factor